MEKFESGTECSPLPKNDLIITTGPENNKADGIESTDNLSDYKSLYLLNAENTNRDTKVSPSILGSALTMVKKLFTPEKKKKNNHSEDKKILQLESNTETPSSPISSKSFVPPLITELESTLHSKDTPSEINDIQFSQHRQVEPVFTFLSTVPGIVSAKILYDSPPDYTYTEHKSNFLNVSDLAKDFVRLSLDPPNQNYKETSDVGYVLNSSDLNGFSDSIEHDLFTPTMTHRDEDQGALIKNDYKLNNSDHLTDNKPCGSTSIPNEHGVHINTSMNDSLENTLVVLENEKFRPGEDVVKEMYMKEFNLLQTENFANIKLVKDSGLIGGLNSGPMDQIVKERVECLGDTKYEFVQDIPNNDLEMDKNGLVAPENVSSGSAITQNKSVCSHLEMKEEVEKIMRGLDEPSVSKTVFLQDISQSDFKRYENDFVRDNVSSPVVGNTQNKLVGSHMEKTGALSDSMVSKNEDVQDIALKTVSEKNVEKKVSNAIAVTQNESVGSPIEIQETVEETVGGFGDSTVSENEFAQDISFKELKINENDVLEENAIKAPAEIVQSKSDGSSGETQEVVEKIVGGLGDSVISKNEVQDIDFKIPTRNDKDVVEKKTSNEVAVTQSQSGSPSIEIQEVVDKIVGNLGKSVVTKNKFVQVMSFKEPEMNEPPILGDITQNESYESPMEIQEVVEKIIGGAGDSLVSKNEFVPDIAFKEPKKNEQNVMGDSTTNSVAITQSELVASFIEEQETAERTVRGVEESKVSKNNFVQDTTFKEPKIDEKNVVDATRAVADITENKSDGSSGETQEVVENKGGDFVVYKNEYVRDGVSLTFTEPKMIENYVVVGESTISSVVIDSVQGLSMEIQEEDLENSIVSKNNSVGLQEVTFTEPKMTEKYMAEGENAKSTFSTHSELIGPPIEMEEALENIEGGLENPMVSKNNFVQGVILTELKMDEKDVVVKKNANSAVIFTQSELVDSSTEMQEIVEKIEVRLGNPIVSESDFVQDITFKELIINEQNVLGDNATKTVADITQNALVGSPMEIQDAVEKIEDGLGDPMVLKNEFVQDLHSNGQKMNENEVLGENVSSVLAIITQNEPGRDSKESTVSKNESVSDIPYNDLKMGENTSVVGENADCGSASTTKNKSDFDSTIQKLTLVDICNPPMTGLNDLMEDTPNSTIVTPSLEMNGSRSSVTYTPISGSIASFCEMESLKENLVELPTNLSGTEDLSNLSNNETVNLSLNVLQDMSGDTKQTPLEVTVMSVLPENQGIENIISTTESFINQGITEKAVIENLAADKIEELNNEQQLSEKLTSIEINAEVQEICGPLLREGNISQFATNVTAPVEKVLDLRDKTELGEIDQSMEIQEEGVTLEETEKSSLVMCVSEEVFIDKDTSVVRVYQFPDESVAVDSQPTIQNETSLVVESENETGSLKTVSVNKPTVGAEELIPLKENQTVNDDDFSDYSSISYEQNLREMEKGNLFIKNTTEVNHTPEYSKIDISSEETAESLNSKTCYISECHREDLMETEIKPQFSTLDGFNVQGEDLKDLNSMDGGEVVIADTSNIHFTEHDEAAASVENENKTQTSKILDDSLKNTANTPKTFQSENTKVVGFLEERQIDMEDGFTHNTMFVENTAFSLVEEDKDQHLPCDALNTSELLNSLRISHVEYESSTNPGFRQIIETPKVIKKQISDPVNQIDLILCKGSEKYSINKEALVTKGIKKENFMVDVSEENRDVEGLKSMDGSFVSPPNPLNNTVMLNINIEPHIESQLVERGNDLKKETVVLSKTNDEESEIRNSDIVPLSVESLSSLIEKLNLVGEISETGSSLDAVNTNVTTRTPNQPIVQLVGDKIESTESSINKRPCTVVVDDLVGDLNSTELSNSSCVKSVDVVEKKEVIKETMSPKEGEVIENSRQKVLRVDTAVDNLLNLTPNGKVFEYIHNTIFDVSSNVMAENKTPIGNESFHSTTFNTSKTLSEKNTSNSQFESHHNLHPDFFSQQTADKKSPDLKENSIHSTASPNFLDFSVKVESISLLNDHSDPSFTKSESMEELKHLIQGQFLPSEIETICAVVDQNVNEELKKNVMRASIGYYDFNLDTEMSSIDFNIASNEDCVFENPAAFDFLNSIKSVPDRDFSRESLFVKFDPLVSSSNSETKLKTPSPPKQLVSVVSPIRSREKLINISPEDEKTQNLKREISRLRRLYEEREKENELKINEFELEVSKAVGTVCFLEQKNQESELRQKALVKKLNEQNWELNTTVLAMNIYKETIENLEQQVFKLKSENDIKVKQLTEERDQLQIHLTNIESAFSDVHAKYERSKTSVLHYKQNEILLKAAVCEQIEDLSVLQHKLELLRSDKTQEIETLNNKITTLKIEHEQEMAKCVAQLRKSELRVKCLQEQILQKDKENQNLNNLCDDIISGRKH